MVTHFNYYGSPQNDSGRTYEETGDPCSHVVSQQTCLCAIMLPCLIIGAWYINKATNFTLFIENLRAVHLFTFLLLWKWANGRCRWKRGECEAADRVGVGLARMIPWVGTHGWHGLLRTDDFLLTLFIQVKLGGSACVIVYKTTLHYNVIAKLLASTTKIS